MLGLGLKTTQMEPNFLISLVLVFCFAQACNGKILLSTLPRTLVVTASPQKGQVLKAGEDIITVNWGLNETLKTSKVDSLYNNVRVILCYAPMSQRDRGWRKTNDNLKKDKTCQFTVVEVPYDSSENLQTAERTIGKEVPAATFFVRVYAYNSTGQVVGFGQTTDHDKITGLFEVEGFSGRHVSLEIASACFSAFSLVSLLGFYVVEKKKNK